MKLLYICTYRFKVLDNVVYTKPAYGDSFWDQFIDSFDKVDVLGEPFKKEDSGILLAPLTRKDVHIDIIPSNSRISDFKNDSIVKEKLYASIKDSDCVLIKIASRKAIMAINIAKQLNKPYMIGVTGDLYRDLRTSSSIFRRLYAPIIYRQTLKAIKDCKFGTYVTDNYLQSVYPISGEMCGYTDTILPYLDETILEKRIEKINNKKREDYFDLGIIGTYHDNRKGYDTAILALQMVGNPKLRLRILGIGTKDDQNKWIEFGHKYKVEEIYFDKPVSGVENVFKWIDAIDVCLLPSRSEGLPRCIVEAISRACPCIISNVCGMPELVNNEWLHDPEDWRKLAELIIRMSSSTDILIQSAKENFAKAHNYTMDVVRKKRMAFFDRFIKYSLLQNNE